MLKSYLKNIADAANRGDAREESYYAALAGLLDAFTAKINKKEVHVTTLPKKTEAGNPDFRIWDGNLHIVGYIEAKDPSVEDLDRVESSEQLKRYRDTFHNLILTNFLEFRLYRSGELISKISIGRPTILNKLKLAPPVENEADFSNLLEKFFAFSLPKIKDAKMLAVELAKRTRFFKEEVIEKELQEEESNGKRDLLGFYEAFKVYLISALTKEEFADLYAQTITYGLFAARTRSENGFNRKLAYDNIPQTIGILRDVFKFVSLGDPPAQMEWIIDDISEALAVTDVKKILRDYFHEGKGGDPVVHFYEMFLTAYDPRIRETRGVYYTPEPVVSYIVRALHEILKEHFDQPDGLAGGTVTVLDPAAGTLTFPAEAAKLAVEEFVSKYGEGGKEKFIKTHILENFFAFELMMAPYAIGHLKMSFLLEELGYKLKDKDRFKLYLTNTLEMAELAQTVIPGMSSLSEESHLAGKVKKEKPILVILGNPPYSGHSANASDKFVTQTRSNGSSSRRKEKTWIGDLIEDYKAVDGKPLGEKNPKWLQDDYVKFIRFAQWKIDTAGEGVLGFITNHSYLDNPTFRGMRRSLMNSFNEIYVFDLHGSSLKKEKCPDGSKDENVFQIKQGVAIAIFIKTKSKKKKHGVYHSEIWGTRESKYEQLSKGELKKTDWKKLSPKSDFYFFISRDEKLLGGYESNPKITDIFDKNSVGIVTARDNLTIRWTPEDAWNTVLKFSKMDAEVARAAYSLGKDSTDWTIKSAQEDITNSGLNRKKITSILYRPFDVRFTYNTGNSGGFHCRPRPETMQHMLHNNLGLLACRQQNKVGFHHAFVTDKIVEACAVSNNSREINYLFPLYIYEGREKTKKKAFDARMILFEPEADYHVKKSNLSQDFTSKLSKHLKSEPSPEQIFNYIYAVLYSNIYRRKYAEFLKSDFPGIPFTGDHDIFKKVADYGKSLIELHLMKSAALDSPMAKLRGKGDNIIEKIGYDAAGGKVILNETQSFDGVSNDVWSYHIGGYQVCCKWLKDRKGNTLSLDKIKHYCRMVTAIQKTMEAQKKVDEIYPDIEKNTIEFKE